MCFWLYQILKHSWSFTCSLTTLHDMPRLLRTCLSLGLHCWISGIILGDSWECPHLRPYHLVPPVLLVFESPSGLTFFLVQRPHHSSLFPAFSTLSQFYSYVSFVLLATPHQEQSTFSIFNYRQLGKEHTTFSFTSDKWRFKPYFCCFICTGHLWIFFAHHRSVPFYWQQRPNSPLVNYATSTVLQSWRRLS